MFNKSISAKGVTIAAFACSILGILSAMPINKGPLFLGILSTVVSSLSLPWRHIIEGLYIDINITNLFFYLLLLIGAINFVVSQGKKIMLIRFVFGVIFYNKLLFLIYSICNFSIYKSYPAGYNTLPVFILLIVARACWVLLSYKVLVFFRDTRELFTEKSLVENDDSVNYVNAQSGKRFLNLLIDVIVWLMVLSVFMDLVIMSSASRDILIKIQGVIGERPTAILLLIVLRTLYYVVFEFFFGGTPGKFLTETRVLNAIGQNPDFKTILVRSLIRFVPFEGISLVFSREAWHDKWSGTYVLLEKSPYSD